MPRRLAWLLLPALVLTGCARRGTLPQWHARDPAARLASEHPRSAISPEADDLIARLNGGDVSKLEASMTPAMRAHYPDGRLDEVSRALASEFGRPLGIVEERVHAEGDLDWYTGLVVHGHSQDTVDLADLTLVLYQFALRDGALHRLLVREHFFPDEVPEPADDYLPVNRFGFPSTGQWTVIQGGPTKETNKHHGHRAQRFGYDLVVKRSKRTRPPGSPKINASYYCYGQPVLAPAPGVVIIARDGVRENIPGVRGTGGGNGVVIDHGFGEYSELWHLIPGTVSVQVGDEVEWGQPLGLVGNSGRSTAPHIHFHVENGPPSAKPWGLPAPFADTWIGDELHPRTMPVRGQRPSRVDPNPPRRGKRRTASGPRVLIAL